eukprot:Blabericola_migrator_1__2170@NODE_159_length_12571_cov_158_810301_g139_i0_p5_GENE_NODE_159_length_12571_cov_158_810301_g139_i0NODE_159_length_12571_cov_158_810301_g139_i0_p5_ORF_typecomplete_len178_score21_11Asp/PF00026_23/7_8e07_NODE_159_length_12571_cov_158_810301_g139_i080478580
MFVTDRVVDASGLAPIYKSGKFDGIFGLGWGVLSVTKAPPPVVLWKQRGLIPRAMFAIRLSKDPHDVSDTIFTLKAINTAPAPTHIAKITRTTPHTPTHPHTLHSGRRVNDWRLQPHTCDGPRHLGSRYQEGLVGKRHSVSVVSETENAQTVAIDKISYGIHPVTGHDELLEGIVGE